MFSYKGSLSCCPSRIISNIYLQQTITDTHTLDNSSTSDADTDIQEAQRKDFLWFCAAIIHFFRQECGKHPDAGGPAICSTIHEQKHREIHPAGKHS